jgi:membrane protein DedA with SNARE-associated domain
MTELTNTLLSLATSPWALLVLLLCCYVDSLFPPVPSEAFVITMGALGVAGNGPSPLVVVLVAAIGAFLGDRTAYAVGRRMPDCGLPFIGAGRAARLQTWARRMLDERGATFILSARYIPVGRVAVIITAGMVRYPARRFTAFAALASLLWAVYSTLIGASVGAVLRDRALVAVLVGVVGGLLIGMGVEAILRRRGSAPTTDQPVTEEALSRT